jgi:cardiolipin synthase
MLVDRIWSVVGSTNFDHRSFGLNDEVNIAALDVQLAARLLQDFESDLEQSKRLTYEDWQKRSVITRVLDSLIGLLEQEE